MFLNYKIQGKGQPLLLIHGLFGSLDNLNTLARHLAKDHLVYQIDLPNHGLSPRLDSCDYVAQADIVSQFIKQQKIINCTLIGHSMGGKVAMMLAMKMPLLVNKLIILDMAPVAYFQRRHDSIFAALNACDIDLILEKKQALAILDAHHIEPAICQFLLKSFICSHQRKNMWRFNLKVIEEHYADILDWPIQNTHFNGPTLFIKGEKSDYILEKYRTDIKTQFPNAKAHIIANAGHWLHAEKPDILSRVIDQFLS